MSRKKAFGGRAEGQSQVGGQEIVVLEEAQEAEVARPG